MFKNLSNLGTVLDKKQLQAVNGGNLGACTSTGCVSFNYNGNTHTNCGYDCGNGVTASASYVNGQFVSATYNH